MTPPRESFSSALEAALRWLTLHAGFPAQRLPPKLELLVLLSAAAQAEERVAAASASTRPGPPRGPSTSAHMRNYTIKRRHAHVKCDNSAKV